MRQIPSRLILERGARVRDAAGTDYARQLVVGESGMWARIWERPRSMDDERREPAPSVHRLLVVNPADDRSFDAFARRLAPECESASELEASLRSRYRHAVVRPRDLSGEAVAVWYVYRDGHWTRPRSDGRER